MTAADLTRWLPSCFPSARWEAPDEAFGLLTHRVRLPGRGPDLPADHLFLDLETLGFVGRPVFLVGLLHATGPREGLLVQLLARDYSEEEGIIRAFAERAGAFPTWVTFNGKSFDVPSLRLRCAFHRLPHPDPPSHLDLLHVARRHFRGVFPDCRLRTLEGRVCGRWRLHDLPGGEVPGAYHRFVRDGDPTLLESILRHNRDDLVTLAELYLALSEMEAEEEPGDGGRSEHVPADGAFSPEVPADGGFSQDVPSDGGRSEDAPADGGGCATGGAPTRPPCSSELPPTDQAWQKEILP